MKKISIIALTLVLLASVALSASLTVKADTACTVTVNNVFDQSFGQKGVTSGGYWVGQIPLTLTSGSISTNTLGFCINFNRDIYIGPTYPATFAPVSDTEEWRAVSYVLTWDNPATNSEGAAQQVAVWRLLNQTRGANYYVEPWLDSSIDRAGNSLADQAWGKDVVRQSDVLSWVSPVTTNMTSVQAFPGQTVTFTAQLTSQAGMPRANVLVQFNATLNYDGHSTLLNSTYVSTPAAYTDSQGQVQVTVKAPGDAQVGSSVAVEAATKSVWPQKYVDTTDPAIQDLIGLGNTFQLTVSSNMCVLGYITVLPESPLGSIAAIGACGSGFVVYVKIKQYRRDKQ